LEWPRRWLQVVGFLIGLAASTLAAAAPAQATNLDLPVPRVTIYPNETISAEQLTERAFVAHTVTRSSVFVETQALVGKVAKRTLLPGQPVPVNAIRDPYLVTQGKPSLVVLENGVLTITMQAIPLQNGGAGDIVALRNPDSGIVIHGTVERDGTVRLVAP
jgi:flagellar basal body P-ring formation protein FlgA